MIQLSDEEKHDTEDGHIDGDFDPKTTVRRECVLDPYDSDSDSDLEVECPLGSRIPKNHTCNALPLMLFAPQFNSLSFPELVQLELPDVAFGLDFQIPQCRSEVSSASLRKDFSLEPEPQPEIGGTLLRVRTANII